MRARRRRSGAAALVAACALAAGALAAAASVASADDAGSLTASAGAVQATLTWDKAEFGVAGPRLVIVRAGATAFDGSPVAAGDGCRDGYCSFLPSGKRTSALQVVDLNGDGEPEVLVDAYTGGAHCCALTELAAFNGSGYAIQELEWGNTGYELQDLDHDGRPELVGLDDAFAGAFSSFAASFFPPRVVDYDPSAKGALRDVTTTSRRSSAGTSALRCTRSARPAESTTRRSAPSPPTWRTSTCSATPATSGPTSSAPASAATCARSAAARRAATSAGCWPS